MIVASELAKLHRKHLLAIAVFTVLNFVFVILLRDVQVADVLLFLAIFAVWISPGYFFSVLATKGQPRRGPFFWVLAIAAGYHISSLFTVIILHVFSLPVWMILLSIAGLTVTGFLILHRYSRKDQCRLDFSLPGLSGLSLAILLCVVLVFVFLVLHPYSNVGRPDTHGLRYNYQFSTTLFHHLSIAGELSRQEIPPENPFSEQIRSDHFGSLQKNFSTEIIEANALRPPQQKVGKVSPVCRRGTPHWGPRPHP